MSVSRGAQITEIEDVYRRRYGEMVRAASGITGAPEAGRDAVHDAFVAAIRGRKGFRRAGTVEAWLWRAVVNAARKSAETRSREQPVAAAPQRSAEVQDDEDIAHLRGAVRLLPDQQRTILFLHYYADLDYETIADVLGIRSGTVGASLNAARRNLRQLLPEVTNA
jgi:RNA polymerase sigma-70 factor (ECF subfamily)